MTRGIGGHQSGRALTVEWHTPPAILAALGPFDLDPCTSPFRPWDTAATHFTRIENGLLRDWWGRVWMNPPYGRAIAPWMARMAAHGVGTALVFARTETEWWFRHVWPAAAAILFLQGRLTFHQPSGEPAKLGHNSGGPSALIAYGLADADRLESSGLAGAFVPLACTGQLVAVLRPTPTLTWRELLRSVAERAGGPISLTIAYALVG